MSQAFSARESGCFSCPARSSGLGPAALSDPPEGTPLQRKAFPEGFHRAGAEPAGNEVGGAVGGQGVAAAPGPVPQPAMLRVAVLGKENWKTNVPDPQPELGGVPGGGKRSELEAPPPGGIPPAGWSTGLDLVGSKAEGFSTRLVHRDNPVPLCGTCLRELVPSSACRPPAVLPPQEHRPAMPPPGGPAARAPPALALPIFCPKLEGV